MRFWGLRLNPSRINQVDVLLEKNVIALGWSDATVLLNRKLSKDKFRELLAKDFPHHEGASSLVHTWRFIREFEVGDIVVIPNGDQIHFVQICSAPFKDSDGSESDTVIRRSILRLLDGQSISRRNIPDELRDALAFRQTSADLSKVARHIEKVLGGLDKGNLNPLTAIEDSSATKSAMEAWRGAFKTIGRNDHGYSRRTFWVEEIGVWLAVGGWNRGEQHRYWNGLGDRLGDDKTRNLVVEVNPPDGGLPRRWQGLTAKDKHGSVWVLHSGELKIAGTSVQLSGVLQTPFPKKLVQFSNGKILPYFVVAELTKDSREVVKQTARFLKECARIRTRITDANNPTFIDIQDQAMLLEESLGFTNVPAQNAKTIERVHAKIWHALRKDLEAKGFTVSNQRVGLLGPDLYTTGGEKRYLIEIKTRPGASDYMKAVGQLLIYERLLKNTFDKVLIVPRGMKAAARQLLSDFGISVVEYDEKQSGVIFGWHAISRT